MSDRVIGRLEARLATLTEIATIADGRVPPEVAVRASATAERAQGRVGHGAAHTVVALAGATGSGKSTLFNALARSELAATGVRRPTTSETQAAAFVAATDTAATDTAATDTAAAALLRWLGIGHHAVIQDPALAGLLLLDLPDHDSMHVAHRQEVDRLVRIVDVFVWVVDPQKYADAALHHGYLRRFAGHADVTIVVLNQIDTLPTETRDAALDDLARILVDDGMPVARSGVVAKMTGDSDGVRLLGVSARDGEGVDVLRRELVARVSEHRAFVDRIDADLDWIADDLSRAIGDRAPRSVPDEVRHSLGAALAGAVGVDAVADAVAATHRRRGALAAGWPVTRWVGRLRPDPLRRLGLERARPTPPVAADLGDIVDRTSLPPASPVARAAVSTAIRRLSEDASRDLPDLWRGRLREVAEVNRADLDDALDRSVGTAKLPVSRPRWWSVVNALQVAVAAAMVVGLLWLLVVFVVAWFKLPDLPMPELRGIPVPTVLAIGGALAGLLLAVLARWATAIGARRRAQIARRRLVEASTDVGVRLVVEPVEAELVQFARLHALTRQLRA